MTTRAAEKSDYKADLARWKKKREDFEKRTKADKAHAKNVLPRLAALSRGGPYRRNGYFYVYDRSVQRGVYDKSLKQLGSGLKTAGKGAQGGVAPGSAPHARLYLYDASRTYPTGTRYNFFASFMPYANEAHHLVPIEAIAAAFNDAQRSLLEKLPYDINHGQNIIFLPKKTKDTPIHRLPQHSGSHPSYNALVKTDLNTLRGQLTAKESEECKPEEPPALAVMDTLIAFEGKYWKFLVKRGPLNINQRAAAELAKQQQSGV